MSCLSRCPYFRESAFRGSTVYLKRIKIRFQRPVDLACIVPKYELDFPAKPTLNVNTCIFRTMHGNPTGLWSFIHIGPLYVYTKIRLYSIVQSRR